MNTRMAKMDRMLTLVHALAESVDGLTLDEMAERVGVNRRTAERMRDVIAMHFDLDQRTDDRTRRFFIREGLRRAFTRPTAEEIAALQAEAVGHKTEGAPRAALLASLLGKVRSALDQRERSKIDPDLEALVRLQRTLVRPGPLAEAEPATLAMIQQAMLTGRCVEFEYQTDDNPDPQWRRVIPYGLLHGAPTYLLGKMPNREEPPVYYRLDRMRGVRLSDKAGLVSDDFDLDAWLEQSFGIWRDDEHDIVLRILPEACSKARNWRFHPRQAIEEQPNGSLIVRFRSAGLRELAEHLFTWAGEIRIEAPELLRSVMAERLELASLCLK